MEKLPERRVCPERLSNRLFLLCAVTYIAGLFGRMSYAAVMSELIAAEGFAKSEAGLVGTALFLVYGICQLFAGLLGDRVSPRSMIFTGVFGSAVLNVGMALAGSYRPMLVLWGLNGAFQALIWSPCSRVFSEVLHPSRRKDAASGAAATYPIATILSYLLASLLLRFAGWRAVFLLSAAIMAAASLYFWHRMAWFERTVAEEGDWEELPALAEKSGSLVGALLVSGAVFSVVGAASHGLLRDGIQSWVPTFLTETFSMGTSLSAALAVVLPLVSLAGVAFTRWWAAHFLKNELIGSAGFLAAVSAALAVLWFFPDRNAALSLGLFTFASAALVGSNTMLINLLPIHFGALGRASSVTGVLNSAAYLGSALSSYGLGWVAERWGWPAAMLTLLGFALFALGTALLGAPRWARFRQRL